MKKIVFGLLALFIVTVLFSANAAFAQEKYPSKPIHFIVPMTAGGGTDRVARALAEALKTHLPQPVVVENLPGAGSVVGMSKLHASRPDGYTLAVVGGYLITTTLQGMAKFPATDFTLVARTSGEAFLRHTILGPGNEILVGLSIELPVHFYDCDRYIPLDLRS